MFFDNLVAMTMLNTEDVNFDAWLPNQKGYRVVLTESDKQRLGLQYIVLERTNSADVWKLVISLSSKKGILISSDQTEKILKEFLTDRVYVNPQILMNHLFAIDIHLTQDIYCSSQNELNKIMNELMEKSLLTTTTERDTIRIQLSSKTFSELYCNEDGEPRSLVLSDSCKKRDHDYVTIYMREEVHGGAACLRIEMKLRSFEKFRSVLNLGNGTPVLNEVLTSNGLKTGVFNKVRAILKKRFKFEFDSEFMHRIYKQARRKLARIKERIGIVMEIVRTTRYVVEPMQLDWVVLSDHIFMSQLPDI